MRIETYISDNVLIKSLSKKSNTKIDGLGHLKVRNTNKKNLFQIELNRKNTKYVWFVLVENGWINIERKKNASEIFDIVVLIPLTFISLIFFVFGVLYLIFLWLGKLVLEPMFLILCFGAFLSTIIIWYYQIKEHNNRANNLIKKLFAEHILT